jgi:hypothetical protein
MRVLLTCLRALQADASLQQTSPLAAVAENKPIPGSVFIPQKFDLYHHLGVLTVPIAPATEELLPTDRTLARRLQRCFNTKIDVDSSAGGCHAAALSFWSRLKAPDVFPREFFDGTTPTTYMGALASAFLPRQKYENMTAEQKAKARDPTLPKEPESEPKTEAEWHARINKMKGDDRQASVLFRLACARGTSLALSLPVVLTHRPPRYLTPSRSIVTFCVPSFSRLVQAISVRAGIWV